MFRLSLLFCPGLLLLGNCCSNSRPYEASPEDVPWTEATFLNPELTTITFTNNGLETRNLDVDLRRYLESLDEMIPESLDPGQSCSVSVSIHRPRYLFYRSGDHQSMRIILPGRSRHLIHDGKSVQEAGDFALEYDYLDNVLIPLKSVERPPTGVRNLAEYRKRTYHSAREHHDSVPRPASLPSFIVPLLDRAPAVGPYQDALRLHSFYLFSMLIRFPLLLPSSIAQATYW